MFSGKTFSICVLASLSESVRFSASVCLSVCSHVRPRCQHLWASPPFASPCVFILTPVRPTQRRIGTLLPRGAKSQHWIPKVSVRISIGVLYDVIIVRFLCVFVPTSLVCPICELATMLTFKRPHVGFACSFLACANMECAMCLTVLSCFLICTSAEQPVQKLPQNNFFSLPFQEFWICMRVAPFSVFCCKTQKKEKLLCYWLVVLSSVRSCNSPPRVLWYWTSLGALSQSNAPLFTLVGHLRL